MSSRIDIELVREYYQQRSNEELTLIATEDAAGMTPEAQQILQQEIVRRKLDVSMIESVKAQNRVYTDEEIDHYCELARSLPCPVCKSDSSKLNGTQVSTTVSFIVFSKYTKEIKIACPACLDKAIDSAMSTTKVFGWWSGHGFVNTIRSIEQNDKAKKTNHNETPNNYLREFVLSKIGQFEMYKDDKEKLQQIILTP